VLKKGSRGNNGEYGKKQKKEYYGG